MAENFKKRQVALLRFNKHERHIVVRGTVPPDGDAVHDFIAHFRERQFRRPPHNLAQSFNTQHVTVRIEALRKTVRIDYDPVAWLKLYFCGRFHVDGIREQAQHCAAGLH